MPLVRLKTAPIKSTEIAVDRENGRLNGVSVMEAGAAIGHGFDIDEQTLNAIVRLGNESKAGIKTRFTHPDMCHDGLGTNLGRSVNFRKTEDGTRVLADVGLLDCASKSPNGDLRGWVLDIAEEDPGQVGMSVVMSGDLEQPLNEDGEPERDSHDAPIPPLFRPQVLHANDLVDDAAANRRGLFGTAELAARIHDIGLQVAAKLDQWINPGQPLTETDMRAVALASGLAGVEALGNGIAPDELGHVTVRLNSDDGLQRAADYLNRYLDRRGIEHPALDAGAVRRIATRLQEPPTMPPTVNPGESRADYIARCANVAGQTAESLGAAWDASPAGGAAATPPAPPSPPADPKPLTQADLNAAAAAAVTAENNRVNEIRALGRLFPDYDLRKSIDACINDTACSVDEARKRVLTAYERILADPAVISEPVTVGDSAGHKFTLAAADGMLLRHNMLNGTKEQKLAVRATGLAGVGPKQIARQCLRLAGERNVDRMSDDHLFQIAMGSARSVAIANDNDPNVLLAVGHATGDFPLILANSGNKAMIRGYELSPTTWPIWCLRGTLSDFKTAKRLRLSESPILVTRPEGLPAEMGTFGESGEDITLVNKAKGFSYTRQMFVNDDLGAFLTLGRRFGNGAAQTIEYLVYFDLTSNSKVGPTMSDSKALFHADHANLNSGGGGVPSQTLIDAMLEAMMIQAGIGEDGALLTVGGPPRFFLAKPSVAAKIAAIIDAPFRGTGAAGDAQSLQAPQDPDIAAARAVKVPQLALQASTDWYGVADQNMAPSYEVAFLNGVETPRTKTVVGTTIDGVTIVVDMDFGIFPTGGHQGINRNAGA